MPVIDVVNYDAIDSGLNPNGLHLVSITGIDRVAKREGLGDQAHRAKRDRCWTPS